MAHSWWDNDLAHETEWPVIKSADPERLAGFYRDVLGFERSELSGGRITLALHLVSLVLVRGTGGLQHSSGHAQRISLWGPPPGDEVVLHIPVPSGVTYLRERGDALAAVPRHIERGTDFFGLYVRDPDGNALCLYRDGHGPYEKHLWEWSYWKMPELKAK